MRARSRPRPTALSTMSKGKIALVTGGNRGIGKEIARQLATKGFRVILTARDPKVGAKAASSIEGDVGFLALDVADDESIAQAAKGFGKNRIGSTSWLTTLGFIPTKGSTSSPLRGNY